MLVQCPSCRTTYKVSDHLVATPNPTFRCSRCTHIFALGLKPEPTRVAPPTAPPPPAPRHAEEGELPFSPPAAQKKEAAEPKDTEPPAPAVQPEPPAVGKGLEQSHEEEPAIAADGPSPSIPETAPTPPAEAARPQLRIAEKELAPDLTGKKEEGWSLASAADRGEEGFSIPEEDDPAQTDPTLAATEFEEGWSDALPLLENREGGSGLDPYRDRPLSIMPYVSLFGVLLLSFSLLTLMYQARPQEIESAIKTIPWLGPALLKNNHLRYGVSLQSLRPGFQSIQGNREVFVLAGVAVNRNSVGVREVRVEGQIFNADGKEIDRQIISVGNAISPTILRDLTAQEISILQKLNPQKRFEILPDESAAFAIVFLKESAEIKNFSCRVLSVDAGA